jgi:two-component system, OmpR family, response regulator VanR
MERKNILIVDDDESIRKPISVALELSAMKPYTLCNGRDVLPFLEKNRIDLVVLDLILKDTDGNYVLKELREKYPRLPVIILSAKKMMDTKLLSFHIGADDYITKPFNMEELIARINARLRQASIEEIAIGDNFRLNLDSLELVMDGKKIQLNARLFKLLRYFIENKGRVLTPRQIYENVWDGSYYGANIIANYVRKLRKIIEDDPNSPKLLLTVPGMGYKLSAE